MSLKSMPRSGLWPFPLQPPEGLVQIPEFHQGTLQELESALSLGFASDFTCPGRLCHAQRAEAEISPWLGPGSCQDPPQARGVQDRFRQ